MNSHYPTYLVFYSPLYTYLYWCESVYTVFPVNKVDLGYHCLIIVTLWLVNHVKKPASIHCHETSCNCHRTYYWISWQTLKYGLYFMAHFRFSKFKAETTGNLHKGKQRDHCFQWPFLESSIVFSLPQCFLFFFFTLFVIFLYAVLFCAPNPPRFSIFPSLSPTPQKERPLKIPEKLKAIVLILNLMII